ncbi:hypothetical protein KKF55_06130 [Patescibacteria group bacterium]|nr:hypothetical protein [Patescibacteria group bacterium]
MLNFDIESFSPLLQEAKKIFIASGALAGWFALFYTIASNIRMRPRIGALNKKVTYGLQKHDKLIFFKGKFSFTLVNRSHAPNTITHVYLTVWKNKRKNSTLRFGHVNGPFIETSSRKSVDVPFHLEPRSALPLMVEIDFPIVGTPDEKIFSELSTSPGYVYQLLFEDIDGTLFAEEGSQHDRREIGLRWTFGNSIRELKKFRLMPLIRHTGQIIKRRAINILKHLLHMVGLR